MAALHDGAPLPRTGVVRVEEGTSEGKSDLRNRVFCSSCGISTGRRYGLAPLGWQEMPDANDRTIALCPECVRRNLWLIEARLDVDPGSGV